MISIQNLNKSFGNNDVLKNINIDFEKGKVYGIVGENGAGKTTLFRCISGLENYNGEIKSELIPLKNYTGFLQTESYFFPKITGKEHLQLLANAREMDVIDIETNNIFDLPLNRYASDYSTGMKKKLALTGVLIQKNDFLILDEPFNGVDIQSNFIITEIIKTLKASGKTVLISSHIFSTLAETCDEIHLLSKGSFVKKVQKEDFKSLEAEMIQNTVGKSIDALF